MRIWAVMDECIRSGVATAEKTLPGRLGLRRRAPILYRRLMRGWVTSHLWMTPWVYCCACRFYPGIAGTAYPMISGGSQPSGVIGSPDDTVSSSRSTATSPTSGQGDLSLPRPARVIGSFDHPILPMPPVWMFSYYVVELIDQFKLTLALL